jgi:alpha-L-fucosidase
MPYTPSRASLRTHPVPDWFHDAKLGIFIHWTPASVPAWAPLSGEPPQVIARHGWRYWFANNPYVEWYANSLRIPGSPTQRYHAATYGADFSYDNFIPMFQQATERWDPALWANIFAEAGARYVVLVTKHHDGFLLWPSQHPNPHKPGYQSRRDLVGELATAVRSRGMRFGTYYSGGLDWTFDSRPIQGLGDMVAAIPQHPEYAAYVDAHWRELIARYQPSVLWNDIGYPARADLLGLFAHYYNTIPDGVVNDRFLQFNLGEEGSWRYRLTLQAVRAGAWLLTRLGGEFGSPGGGIHADFRTPEYTAARKITPWKWEATRGMGYSFGYNQLETDQHMIPVERLIHLLVDIVSKNGNLLLNVGPMADGTIPEIQLRRLRGLGSWLARHGEAIYGTRPWVRAEGSTADGTPLRYTCRGNILYAVVLGRPAGPEVVIRELALPDIARVRLLGHEEPLAWQLAGRDLRLRLPSALESESRAQLASPAWVFKIERHGQGSIR